jgi:uncharacterized membrane protein YidH (DUF202 family)
MTDPGLANERTALAWTRTALGVAAVGALIVRLAIEVDLAVVALGCAAVVAAAATAIWRHGGRA